MTLLEKSAQVSVCCSLLALTAFLSLPLCPAALASIENKVTEHNAGQHPFQEALNAAQDLSKFDVQPVALGLVTEKEDGTYSFESKVVKEIDSLALVHAVDADELELNFSLNGATRKNISPEKLFSLFTRTVNIEGLIFSSDKNRQTFLVAKNPAGVPQRHPFSKTENGVLRKSLYTKLGYDAVVLDRKGKWLLMWSEADLLKPGQQGFVHSGRLGTALGSPQAAQPNAIIECIEAKGRMGVFRIVLGGESTALKAGAVGWVENQG